MLPMLALGALQLGGSLIAGKGAADAAAKTARLQAIADQKAYEDNAAELRFVNDRRAALGRELLEIPETLDESRSAGGWIDVEGMLGAAQKLGVNPYAFMQAGGLSAYAQTWETSSQRRTGHNAADAFKLMVPEYQIRGASQVPAQKSTLEGLGNGLIAAGNAMGTQYRADQSYDLQMQKMDMAQDQFMLGLAQNGYQTAISLGGRGGGLTGSGAGTARAGGLSDKPMGFEADNAKVTNPFYRGFIDSKSPNAEAGEDRYGELGEFLFGARNIVNDTVRNVTGRGLEDWGTAAGMNIGSFKKKDDETWAPAFSRWWNSPNTAPTKLQEATPGWLDTIARGYQRARDNWRSNGLLAN